jgi:hypothetical protein
MEGGIEGVRLLVPEDQMQRAIEVHAARVAQNFGGEVLEAFGDPGRARSVERIGGRHVSNRRTA